MAGLIAGKIDGDDFVGAAYELLLGRQPEAVERRECETALAELEQAAATAKKANPAQRARRGLVHALLNHNDFVSIR